MGSKEERWNGSSTPLLAPHQWQDVKAVIVLCNVCQQSAKAEGRAGNIRCF